MGFGFLQHSEERAPALVRSIEARLVADLIYHTKGVIAGTLVLYAVNLAFYKNLLPTPWLTIWSALLLGSCVIRAGSLLRYRQQPEISTDTSSQRWHQEIVIAYAMLALGWGLLGVLSVVMLPAAQSIVAIAAVAGITGSAAATTSASPTVFRLVACLALAPLTLATLLSSHEALPYVGVMTACYLGVLNRASQRIHETLLQSVTFGLENDELVKTLETQSSIDSLTGLSNRRALNIGFEKAWKNGAKQKLNVGLILCDVDHFKEYNDTHGHLAGDHCLQCVADALVSVTRSTDLITARYGGEEFAVLIPQCKSEELATISERLRNAVHARAIPHGHSSVSENVTMSVGASHLIPSPAESIDGLIRAADDALYKAKRSGRNCVQIDHDLAAAAR